MATVSLASGMVPTPSNVAVATTSNYVGTSTLINADRTDGIPLHKRDVDEQLIKRYGNQGITGLMELLGNKIETTQQTFEHYEETFLHNHFTGVIGGGSGVVNIDDTFDDLANGNGRVALRVGDLVLGGSGSMYYVSAGSGDDYTLKNLSDNNTASNDADTKFTIIGNAYAERTEQPVGITPRVDQYQNKCQIIKESFTV